MIVPGIVLRAARAGDAAAAAPLIQATGPRFFRHVFGLGRDEPRAQTFLRSAFRHDKGPFSHVHAVVASIESAEVCGVALGYPARRRAAIDRGLVGPIARAYRPWEWPALVRRGMEAQRFMEGIDPESYYLAAIAVTPERQGTGVAGRLLEDVLARAATEGLSRCELHVSHDNGRARRFYERGGFRVVREVRHAALERRSGLPGQVLMAWSADAS